MIGYMIRKRKLLFTDEEFAKESGLSVEELIQLEESFITDGQKKYLDTISYRIDVFPLKKPNPLLKEAAEEERRELARQEKERRRKENQERFRQEQREKEERRLEEKRLEKERQRKYWQTR
jgi:transcriptional regulator with XRE-family HTH domain